MATHPTSQIPLASLSSQRGASDATTAALPSQPAPLGGQSHGGSPVNSQTAANSTTGSGSVTQLRPSISQYTPQRPWWDLIAVVIAAFTLILTTGMSVPGFQLAKWTAHNDYLQSCIAMVGLREMQDSQCNDTIKSGPIPPPLLKRGFVTPERTENEDSTDGLIVSLQVPFIAASFLTTIIFVKYLQLSPTRKSYSLYPHRLRYELWKQHWGDASVMFGFFIIYVAVRFFEFAPIASVLCQGLPAIWLVVSERRHALALRLQPSLAELDEESWYRGTLPSIRVIAHPR